MSCKRIRLVVKDSADESSYVPVLEAAGYVQQIREPGWFEHRLFKRLDTDINLHVFSLGTSEIDRMLRFRDWLRTNDTDRDKYAQVKRSLAKNKWRHTECFLRRKCLVERGDCMSIQIIHHQNDFLRVRVCFVHQPLHLMKIAGNRSVQKSVQLWRH